ncbi:MAG: Mpo1-like protein, partial [Gemmataceae bacterium]
CWRRGLAKRDANMSEATTTPNPSSRRWPILRFLRRRLLNWRERHRLPFNFYIHLIGIPLAVSGVVMLFFQPWYWGVAALVAGYLLQWIGHRVEGNDVGEWAAVKRLLGLPYVGIAPRWRPDDPNRL